MRQLLCNLNKKIIIQQPTDIYSIIYIKYLGHEDEERSWW